MRRLMFTARTVSVPTVPWMMCLYRTSQYFVCWRWRYKSVTECSICRQCVSYIATSPHATACQLFYSVIF